MLAVWILLAIGAIGLSLAGAYLFITYIEEEPLAAAVGFGSAVSGIGMLAFILSMIGKLI